jgi:molybdate transport system substrate-binding protein
MKILCSNGLKAVLLELLPAFERQIGKPVSVTWSSTNMLLDDIAKGATGDLTILTDEAINSLIKQGKVLAGSRVDLARSAIGIAVRSGARKPDIGNTAAFRRTLLDAKSLAVSRTGISGVYFPIVLERIGIADEMKSKIVMPESGPVGEVLARGEVELAIQQISELLPVPGIEIVGPLPDELQKITIFSAGLFVGSGEAREAKVLVAALTNADAAATYRQKGMDPVC